MSRSSFPKKAVRAASTYLKTHPEEVVRAAKNAASLRVGVPLSALRWLIRELWSKQAPRDLRIEAKSPGIFVSGIVTLMKTDVRFSTVLLFERIDFGPEALFVTVRLSQFQLQVTDDAAATPISALLRSGALDLSRPGDLVSYLPSPPPFLLEAKGDRFELDLLRLPALSQRRAQLIVRALTPWVGVGTVRSADDHIDIALKPLPAGARSAFERFKKLF